MTCRDCGKELRKHGTAIRCRQCDAASRRINPSHDQNYCKCGAVKWRKSQTCWACHKQGHVLAGNGEFWSDARICTECSKKVLFGNKCYSCAKRRQQVPA